MKHFECSFLHPPVTTWPLGSNILFRLRSYTVTLFRVPKCLKMPCYTFPKTSFTLVKIQVSVSNAVSSTMEISVITLYTGPDLPTEKYGVKTK